MEPLKLRSEQRSYAIVTCPERETLATKGPGEEESILQIRGRAVLKTAAISVPRRLPAVKTKTLALLARSAAISSGRYLSRWSLVSTTQPR